MKPLLSKIIAMLGIIACQPVAAQSYPHDPQLLSKLQAGAFDRIGKGPDVALGLSAIIHGLSDAGCVVGDADASVQEVLQWTVALGQEAQSGLFAMHMIQAHPSYQQTLVLAGKGCLSTPVRQLGHNLVVHLRHRYTTPSAEEREAQRRTALTGSQVRPVSRTVMYEDATPFENQVGAFRQRSPAQVLVCTYGYSKVYYWHERVWHSRKELRAIAADHPWLRIPERPVAECPATLGDAAGLR
ncbi:MAG: hypothetical protein BGO61_05335 [Thiobacillus sp. 65-69]|jgi:hypothetical protein|nr:hypothetical protein [Thiobacillus sp.]ODU89808.1 MAG: hypothetical protein ABT21_09005 [Thiobacillus sp. SCN 65-179]OJW37736.1 MAG: hypothetical protein BGO61_05335 [Thiobacillus sp. 65-69]